LDHLPYGVAVLAEDTRHLLVRIGDHALDLHEAASAGMFDGLGRGSAQLGGLRGSSDQFDGLGRGSAQFGGVPGRPGEFGGASDEEIRRILLAPLLNPLMAAGPEVWAAVRERIVTILTDAGSQDRAVLRPVRGLHLVLAWQVGDYVDFYSSRHHAENVGRMFRPDAEPLLPNWTYMPVGYHGRAGTVVVSGTEIVRPCGQLVPAGFSDPVYGPSGKLDLEAEVGFVVGVPTSPGHRVSTVDFERQVFGVVLVNDWSARDLQAWEYVPLGPFLAKSFATSVSRWVTPLAALSGARVPGPVQNPPVLEYLSQPGDRGYDLTLEVRCNGELISRPPFASMYWSPAQQLAHLTVNGASLRTGDLYASGTVSGPEKDQRGSFLELAWNGAEPLVLADGSSRSFLADGDEVTVEATAPSASGNLTLGAVTGRIRPALPS
jgi:fumarylacetoacetase